MHCTGCTQNARIASFRFGHQIYASENGIFVITFTQGCLASQDVHFTRLAKLSDPHHRVQVGFNLAYLSVAMVQVISDLPVSRWAALLDPLHDANLFHCDPTAEDEQRGVGTVIPQPLGRVEVLDVNLV
jgi:hypothetical protein